MLSMSLLAMGILPRVGVWDYGTEQGKHTFGTWFYVVMSAIPGQHSALLCFLCSIEPLQGVA